MGCSPSYFGNDRTAPFFGLIIHRAAAAGVSAKLPSNVFNKSNGTKNPDIALCQLLRVLPPIQIDIGSRVLPAQDLNQIVIFVFGGPGSLKGILTQELAEEFEFVTITVEDIVFSYLPHKVANTVKNIVEIQELMRRDNKVINLKWILQMISTKLGTSTSQRFVIDIVPELTSLLRSSAFANADDHSERLEEFDRKHHVLFALELFITEEQLIMVSKGSSSLSSQTKNANNVSRSELSPEMSAFLNGVDEADKCRLDKRIHMFRMCSEPFLNYFRKSKRVVRIDLKVPNNEELVPTIRSMLIDFGFGRNNDSIRVVLFISGDHQLEEIDLEYYRLRKLRLLDICHDPSETLAQQIRAIRKFIYRTAQPNENIVINLKGLNNTNYSPIKRINFLEYHTTYLDFYIRNREKSKPRSRCKMSFRAITSTSGEVCLFPERISSSLCKKIGYVFGEKLSLSETDTRAPSQLSGEDGGNFTGGLPAPSFIGS